MAKAKDKFVFSTISTSVEIVEYKKGGGDLPIKGRSVIIKGGANVPDKRLITRAGVMTRVSAEDAAWLVQQQQFKDYMKNGYIKMTDASVDEEVVAADMQGRDKSAPLQPGDFSGKDGDKEPVTNARKA